MAKSVGTHLFNAFRGALIGTAEVVPGVSGGTVALIVGIYENLITSAGHAVNGIRLAAGDLPRGRGGARAAEEFRKADWGAIIAVLIGMVLAALVAAKFLAPLVEHEQQYAYAVFFGLILASLWVPYSGSGRTWRPGDYLVALAVAAVTFLLTGLPPAHVEPNFFIVVGAAAIAVCALVLPGVSGSFILLTFGLYTATMDALNARDFGYIGTFALGAIIGLAFFVKLLQWLMESYHHITLVVLTGLMAGSLRALWPWQDEHRTLQAPQGDIPVTVALAVLGFAVVVAVLLFERRVQARRQGAANGAGQTRGRHRSADPVDSAERG
ncbi:DUF368 domain-containing protein [Nocardiopsis gilva YIM 90087]|uniref:DUF368 domain-containing protein n=1 Tax=Nocardiopsis gilva YIM 90087 TaxID=1235441 RepID=A0A223SA56_9ACTN|nr:DUF368 domain-containing protein [Nocardiopsis gilva]ASU84983.1 DUF368 domain-containing protein [Nocardiopsis gilva YIM 90087]